MICFPPAAILNERYIHIGAHTMIGPHVTLSAGMVPGQACLTDPVVRIGDRCLLGRGSGIVGHLSIEIEDDVWTGHNVYITDQNHGYADLDRADLATGDARAPGAHRRRLVARPRHRRAARGDDRPARRDRRQQRRARGDPGLLRRRRQPGPRRQADARPAARPASSCSEARLS